MAESGLCSEVFTNRRLLPDKKGGQHFQLFLYTFVANTFGKTIFVIKWLIHFPLLSPDTSLHRPSLSFTIYPPDFKIAKQRPVQNLLGSVGYRDVYVKKNCAKTG